MTRLESSRVNETIGIHIGMVQQAARKLRMGDDIQTIEADLTELEKCISGLREVLSSVPHHA
ncbi:hypothetical protein GMLC_02700 [Geomonas limicola]|uniref:Uncharacterized protein n=1 Tax=Geomonas limicola TaxID=2740186 RepID=A0A6V8N2N7_9BACT|nr:hypothetical protein [Geomonas limicola]GFO66691.1 hypothetical protein GMLC_02700 [Geomonas limicola]